MCDYCLVGCSINDDAFLFSDLRVFISNMMWAVMGIAERWYSLNNDIMLNLFLRASICTTSVNSNQFCFQLFLLFYSFFCIWCQLACSFLSHCCGFLQEQYLNSPIAILHLLICIVVQFALFSLTGALEHILIFRWIAVYVKPLLLLVWVYVLRRKFPFGFKRGTRQSREVFLLPFYRLAVIFVFLTYSSSCS